MTTFDARLLYAIVQNLENQWLGLTNLKEKFDAALAGGEEDLQTQIISLSNYSSDLLDIIQGLRTMAIEGFTQS